MPKDFECGDIQVQTTVLQSFRLLKFLKEDLGLTKSYRDLQDCGEDLFSQVMQTACGSKDKFQTTTQNRQVVRFCWKKCNPRSEGFLVVSKFPKAIPKRAPKALHILKLVLLLGFADFFQYFIPRVRLMNVDMGFELWIGTAFVFF